jgi:hypothetical protein
MNLSLCLQIQSKAELLLLWSPDIHLGRIAERRPLLTGIEAYIESDWDSDLVTNMGNRE